MALTSGRALDTVAYEDGGDGDIQLATSRTDTTNVDVDVSEASDPMHNFDRKLHGDACGGERRIAAQCARENEEGRGGGQGRGQGQGQSQGCRPARSGA